MDPKSAESQKPPPMHDDPGSVDSEARKEVARQQTRLFTLLHDYQVAATGGAPMEEITRMFDGIVEAVGANFAAQQTLLQQVWPARAERQRSRQARVLDELAHARVSIAAAGCVSQEDAVHLVDALVVYLVSDDLFARW
jgi:hypothetical protein